MPFLIDTHTFLWFVEDAEKLSPTAKKLLEDEQNEIFISIVSLWEISIKTALGKLAIAGNYDSVIDDVVNNSFAILPLNFAHTVLQNQLPFYHRDPFDRMLISQAIVENLSFISADKIFDEYLQGKSVARIW